MKLCAIQIPFADNPADAEKSVDMLIAQLQQCDESCDIILTPEYSNAPGIIPAALLKSFAPAQSEKLLPAVIETARRCKAVTAVNFLAEVSPGEFRNITRIFDRQGNCAGEFHKQHLPQSEKNLGVAHSYTADLRVPEIVEIDGIRFGFLICYDTYFTEYIAHLAYRKPDVILVSSFQRAEKQDVLKFMNQNLAFNCNAFVLRSSVSMGVNAAVGGMSMVVDPTGNILAQAGSRVGLLSCEVDDIHYKYMRSNSFRGALIPNDQFISQGRTTWNYRPCGSMTIPGEKLLSFPRICADRGFCTIAPENSMASFGAAVSSGAEEIGVEVCFSADGVPVVSCDEIPEKISGISRKIGEFTYSELLKLDFGSCFNRHFAGSQIVSLEELLARFTRQVIINLHLKSISGNCPDNFILKIIELLKKYDAIEHVYFTAAPEILQLVQKSAPEIPRCLQDDAGKYEIVDNAVKYNCQKVLLSASCCNQEMIGKAHANGIKCNYCSCNDPQQAVELLQMGMDTILTNDCFIVAKVVKQYKADKQNSTIKGK
ncbi:MAG: hypothetical protein IKD23_01300 [Lentisphaeria bacterium]|nr:hypothetical protein [Lentisphaeria bacterium]